MSSASKKGVLAVLLLFTIIFGVLIFTEDTGDLLTGSAAGDFNVNEDNGMALKTKVIYILGIVVLLLLVTYLVLLHKYKKKSS